MKKLNVNLKSVITFLVTALLMGSYIWITQKLKTDWESYYENTFVAIGMISVYLIGLYSLAYAFPKWFYSKL